MYHQKISSIIVAITTLSILTLINTSARATTLQYSSQFGTYGTDKGELNSPWGVAVDGNSGNVYVADTGNERIDEFTSTGSFITSFGSFGTGIGQFFEPGSVAVDNSGNVYVADLSNFRIDKFDPNNFLNTFTSFGSPAFVNGQNVPTVIAISPSGNIYVSDFDNRRIDEFNSTGTFITSFGSPGTGNGQFGALGGIAVDTSGNVYVADNGNNRIQEFNSSGTFITSYGSYGTGNGQFNGPESITIDSSNNVYVFDASNFRVDSFNPNNFSGTFTSYGSYGTGNGQFDGISTGGMLAVNSSSGNIYVADPSSNSRVQILSSTTSTQVPFEFSSSTGLLTFAGTFSFLGVMRKARKFIVNKR